MLSFFFFLLNCKTLLCKMWRSNCLCLWLSFSANWLIKSCFVVAKPLFHISRLHSKAVLLFLNLFLISMGYIQKPFCCFWTSFSYQWVTFKSCFVVSEPLSYINGLHSKAILLFLNFFLISVGYVQKLFCCFWTSFSYRWVSCILHLVPTSPQHEFNELLTSPIVLLACRN